MSDLIYRQDAIEELHKQCVKRRMDGDGELFDEFDIEDVLRKLPSAEPERRPGKWIEDETGYGFWTCSVCGFVTEASAANILYHFCPHCGAEMTR